jgi:serine/threonine protein phosphatase 1
MQEFPKMKIKGNKIAVIGDIHGCYFELCKLYNKLISYTPEIYSVGDLIDRGPDSKDVIQFCIDCNTKPVMGNHEDMLIEAIRNPRYETVPGYENNKSIWLYNGGDKTIRSYLGRKSSSIKKFTSEFKSCGHYDFISNLPLKIELEHCIISHGGLITGKPDNNSLWNRDLPSKLDKLQVFGHTPVESPEYIPGHYINIDIGCVYNGKLTGVVISDNSAIFIN